MKVEPYLEIYDFEATDLFNPEPTQIGLVSANKDLEMLTCNDAYIKPKGKISFPAMGITGITPETVENSPSAEELLSEDSYFAPDEGSVYVASYNWDYDKQFIPESWLVGKKVICLLKVARMLVDKQLSGDHKLSTLWYYYGHYKTKDYGNAHDAGIDCKMTLDVLKSMLDESELTLDEVYTLLYDPTVCKGGKKYEIGTPWKEIITKDYDYVEYVLENVKDMDQKERDYIAKLVEDNQDLKEKQLDIISFGKEKGNKWSDIINTQPDYVEWCLTNLTWRNEEVKNYIKDLINNE